MNKKTREDSAAARSFHRIIQWINPNPNPNPLGLIPREVEFARQEAEKQAVLDKIASDRVMMMMDPTFDPSMRKEPRGELLTLTLTLTLSLISSSRWCCSSLESG